MNIVFKGNPIVPNTTVSSTFNNLNVFQFDLIFLELTNWHVAKMGSMVININSNNKIEIKINKFMWT